ncbi:carboxymuconolactone decarboxylase family protein [Streptomyces sp. NPDC056121]|uniref:carboxymuconolactone decarboxylase family protein n=1 Tax=Streptomyces TaxID=1883 RepID=UPI001D09FD87|nr:MULTISPECIES: carboxymuconolactone decarboxylase family protein [Streptomyces]MCX5083587.1 carboxymuconolactone decarboxylase family protein [Streptomyces sp. NBC_00401]UDM01665.1 carboxymuconolactone decarboxylase family protein [Streptomyces longhuiensis]
MTTNENTTDSARQNTDTATKEYVHEHAPRLAWAKHAPEVYKAMIRLDAEARKGVDPVTLELVKIRASQLNHCAFCLDMHSKDALAAGESVERIIQLGAWEESQHFYTPREIAAIELTEAITVLTDGFVPDETYEKAAKLYDEKELTQLIAAITVINAWNRFGVSTRMVPGHYTAGDFK